MRHVALISLLCSLLLACAGCESSGPAQPSNTQAAASPAADATLAAPATAPPGEQQTQPVSNTDATTAQPKFDACTLLTKEEIQAVQGDAIKDTKSDSRAEGSFLTSQCFYMATNFAKSVSLSVTQSAPGNTTQRSPKDFWRETFRDAGKGEEKEREGEREKEREREKDKKKEADRDKDRDREQAREKEEASRRGGREEEEEEATPPKKITGVGDEAYWAGSRVGGALYVLKKDAFIRISVGGPDKEDVKINKSKTLALKALKKM